MATDWSKFTPVTDSAAKPADKPATDWSQFKPIEKRGALGEIGNQLKAGVLSDLPEMAGNAIKYASDPGKTVYKIGQGIADWGTEQGRRADLQASPEDHNIVTNALASGARMIPQSLAPAAAIGAGLALLPEAAIGGTAALAASAIGGAVPMGMSQAQTTLEKAREKGVNEADALAAARRTGLIEAAGETAGTYAGGKLLGIGAKIAQGIGGKAAENTLAQMTNPGVVKPFLKELPKAMATEVGTEMAQNAGEAAVEQKYGIDNQTPGDAAMQAVAPTIGMTLLLAPFGLAGFANNARASRAKTEALSAQTTEPADRKKIADQFTAELTKVDPGAAAQFAANTDHAIANGLPITVDASLFGKQTVDPNAGAISKALAQHPDMAPAAPAVQPDQTFDPITGPANYANVVEQSAPMALDAAQGIAASMNATQDGTEGYTVAPHGNAGFTVVPTAWLSDEQLTSFASIQGDGGRLTAPAPDQAPIRVDSQGNAAPETTDQAAEVAAMKQRYIDMGKPTPRGANPNDTIQKAAEKAPAIAAAIQQPAVAGVAGTVTPQKLESKPTQGAENAQQVTSTGTPDASSSAQQEIRQGSGNTAVGGQGIQPGGQGQENPVSSQGQAQQVANKSEDIAGEKLDKKWTAFDPASGTLGIDRAAMPQIKTEHRGAMVNFLNARGITSEQATVLPTDLKPTQREFSTQKVEQAKNFTGNDRSILISSDGYVLDGHHQWLAKRESGQPVKAIRLNAPIRELLPVVSEFPSAQTAPGATAQNGAANGTADATSPALAQAGGEAGSDNGVQGVPAALALPAGSGVGSAAEGTGTGGAADLPAGSTDRNDAVAKHPVIARVGTTPKNTEPVTVRNGVVHLGDYPAQDFETGDDITVPKDATFAQVKDALKAGNALSNRQRLYSGEAGAIPATKPAKALPANADEHAEQARKRFVATIKQMGGIKTDEARDITGEPAHIANRMNVGLFRKDGNALDLVARKLNEAGYLTDAEYNDVDGGVQRTRELVNQALGKEAVMTAAEQERYNELAEREQQLAEQEAEIDLPAADETLADILAADDAPLPDYAAIAQDNPAEAMRASGLFTEDEINAELNKTRQGAEAAGGTASRTSGEGAQAGEDQAGAGAGAGRNEGFALQGQTAAQVAAAEKKAKEEADKAEREANRATGPNVTADQVYLFNTQEGLFNSNRGEAPAERFEIGAALTKEQRKTVLASLVDVYKQKGAEKETRINSSGDEYTAYPYQPELFEKSDITGAMVRYHVTLPDGRIAHPTELFPDMTDAKVESLVAEQVARAKQDEINKQGRIETLNRRMADSISEANRLFWKQQAGVDINPEDTALLTNGAQYVRTLADNAERDAGLLGGEWAKHEATQKGGTPLTQEQEDANSVTAAAQEFSMQIENDARDTNDFDPSEIPVALRYWAEDGKKLDVDALRTALIGELKKRKPFPRRADVIKVLEKDANVATEGGNPVATKEAKAAPEKEAASLTPLESHKDLFDRVADGKVTTDEFKSAYAGLLENKEAIKAELNGLTKAKLFESYPGLEYRYKNEKKSDIVDAAYRGMMTSFTLSNSLSYGMGNNAMENAIQAIVDNTTDQSMADYAAEVQAHIAERVARHKETLAGVENPKTLDDFDNLMRVNAAKMDGKPTFQQARMTLTPEQRAQFDILAAEKSRKERANRKEADRSYVPSAGATTGAEIIATKHTRDGYDLFVVKPAERVERDVYNTWLSTAKSLSGWYSPFAKGGAIPGFQFKTRESAEAFQKYVSAGDTQAVKDHAKTRRDAYADDRSQTSVERLTEMADSLEGKADASLGQQRKANTDKRARQAASAEASANRDKAMAQTMRNIAGAIENGTAKMLDRVRQKVQVETLYGFVNTAQSDKLRVLYPAYAEQQKHEGEKPNAETADYVTFPSYTAFRSDLASLGRALLDTEGTKKLGQRLMKVADDVSDAYLKFAKENIDKVSTFRTKSGERAAFPSKAMAEASIQHSGYKGAAIVLPVKRNENLIILSPSEAIKRGVWEGDNDKRISLSGEFGEELVEKLGKMQRRNLNSIAAPWQFDSAYDKRKRLAGMGIETPAELRAAVREFIALREAPKEADKIKEMERAMIGRRNDGLDFFPTPASVADEMVSAADIQDGMRILEPSAGMGHIAELIRKAGVDPDVIELSNERNELLEAKGFNVVGRDFMDVTEGGYDRILMNPPFGDRRDAAHVQHAYELLKPGGRLVSIMGEGVFFGSDKKAQAFRDWLEQVGATDEKLDEGTFLDPSLPVNTGTNARMVVIDKPGPEFQPPKATDTGTAMFSRKSPVFYSPLARAFDQAKQSSMPAGMWKAWLNSNAAKLGLKKDEITWSGIEEFLDLQGKAKVAKADITAYLNDSGVKVEDVVLGEGNTALLKPFTVEEGADGGWVVLDHNRPTFPTGRIADGPFVEEWEANNRAESLNDDLENGEYDGWEGRPSAMDTKFSQYTPPGGIPGTYRETLVTLPAKADAIERPQVVDMGAGEDGRGQFDVVQNGEVLDTLNTWSAATDAAYGIWENAKIEANRTRPNFASSHFDQPNILVHLRTDEVTGADGKRYLRVVEIQSDWGQKGKKEGFEPKQEKEWIVRLKDGGAVYRRVGSESEAKSLIEGQPELEIVEGERTIPARVPAAPFVTDTRAWVSLGIKRAIIQAAESGVDGIVFATGQQNADLYDLSKSISRVVREGQHLKAYGMDGATVIDQSVTDEQLPDYIGKEAAQKLMDQPGKKLPGGPYMRRELSGLDLKVGGEGMRAFYDTIVPSVANEVLKKVGGGKVEQVAMNVPATAVKMPHGWVMQDVDGNQVAGPEGSQAAVEALYQGTQPGFAIPEALRAKIQAEGMPLFKQAEATTNGLTQAETVKRMVRVQNIVNDIKAGWKNAPKIIVVSDMQDLNVPQEVRDLDEQMKRKGATGEPRGFINKGTVYIVAGQNKSVKDVVETLAHESLGHAGLRGLYGKGLETVLSQIVAMRRKDIVAKAREYTFHDDSITDKSTDAEVWAAMSRENKLHAAEEVLAEMAESQPQAGFVKRAIAAIRNWLRDNGLNMKLTDGDIVAKFILPARAYIENGAKPVGLGQSLQSAFSRANSDIMFSRTVEMRAAVSQRAADLLTSQKTFNNWWHKTVGTQYHKAQVDPDFRPAFNAVQSYLQGTATFANSAADLADRLIPQLNSLRDLWNKKQPSPADIKAISGPIFAGTLEDETVYGADDLRGRFKLTDGQIDLYVQFRAAVDKSLDDLGKTDILRYAGAAVSDMRDEVMAASTASRAAIMVAARLNQTGKEDDAKVVMDKGMRVADLKAKGYAPLTRFGRYTLHVTEGDEQLYFSLFESEAEANAMARQMKAENPGATVTQGVLSAESYRLFNGLSPDTLELFAGALGVEKNEIVQEYIKLAKNNRSAMKRLLKRKGIAGFSEDVPRILASFITSNARQASANVYGGDMDKAAEAIPKEKGDVKDEAIKMIEFARNPVEDAAKLRGLLFVQYIGGSVASAVVNMTQPLTMSLPYLHQFSKSAPMELAKAMKQAAIGGDLEPELKKALKRAEADGVVSPQEIHQLQAEAMKKGAGIGALARMFGVKGDMANRLDDISKRGLFVWGSMFSMAEQFNRRATFIAAYNIARQNRDADPFAFAEKAVVETQGIYNRGNRPDWARGAVGATVFTFKQYSISYMEFLKRLPPKERAIALTILVLAAGLQGIPFADDLDDLIDTLAQYMGYAWNTKAEKEKFAASILGQTGSDFVLHGTSALPGIPLDFASRLGMSNLLPGTGILLKNKTDKAGEVFEVIGPAGGVMRDALNGQFMPLAVRNMLKAADMANTGMYRDYSGKKVIETDAMDAAMKLAGFNPASVARESRAARMDMQDVQLARNVESEIAEKMAQGVFRQDKETVAEARDMLTDWNRKNPTKPIVITSQQIMQRVKKMAQTRRERLIASAPKELRSGLVD